MPTPLKEPWTTPWGAPKGTPWQTPPSCPWVPLALPAQRAAAGVPEEAAAAVEAAPGRR